jgi:hypothetical protein
MPGDADVIGKVQTDLAVKDITVTEAELRVELTRAGAEARRQLSQSKAISGNGPAEGAGNAVLEAVTCLLNLVGGE